MKFVLFLTDSYGMTPEDYLQPTSQRDYFCSTFGVFFFVWSLQFSFRLIIWKRTPRIFT